MRLAPQRSPWMDDALCTKTDPDLFFPGKSGNPNPAKQICAQCPVRTQCLMHALNTREPRGVWGGMTPNERKRITGRKDRG